MSDKPKGLKVEHELHRLQIATGGGPMAYVVVSGSKTVIIEFTEPLTVLPNGTLVQTQHRVVGQGATINEAFASARRYCDDRIARHAEELRDNRQSALGHNKQAALAQSMARTAVLDAKGKK